MTARRAGRSAGTRPSGIARSAEPGPTLTQAGSAPSLGRADALLPYVVAVIVLLILKSVLPPYTCDDAFISMKVAVNLAEGRGMTFNPGEAAYVTTSPLWVLLLAAGRTVTGDVLVASRWIVTVLEVLLVIVFVHLTSGLSRGRRIGAISAVLLVTNPAFLLTSSSGMELPLYLLVIVLSIDLFRTGHYAVALAVAATAVWVRFDGVLLYGVLAASVLIVQRRELRTRLVRVLAGYLPSVLILLAYILFGYLVFDMMVPASVQRKALSSPNLFSAKWQAGAMTLAAAFGQACLGNNAAWYRAGTPFLILFLPFLVGMTLFAVRRQRGTFVLLVFSVVYFLALTGSGAGYTRNFPWYFVPVLPAVCLAAGTGLVWILERFSEASKRFRALWDMAVPELVFIVVWTVVLYFGAIQTNTAVLAQSAIGTAERERAYAAAAVWAGRNLDPNATVAANEIGAVGFFLPPDAEVLDMFGLLRPPTELKTSWSVLFKRQPPELVITRRFFAYRKSIERNFPNRYRWGTFRTVELGLRRDIARKYAAQLQELPMIYRDIDVSREWPWAPRPPHILSP